MNEIKTAFITHFDVFFWGFLMGGLFVLATQFIQTAMNQWLYKNRLKLDLTLGKALQEMKDKLNDKP